MTAQDIADAIEDVAVKVPHLRISVGHCHGRDWLVDTEDAVIYVSAHLTLARWGEALLDALDALCDDYHLPRRGQILRLIPAMREDPDQQPARTGTSN